MARRTEPASQLPPNMDLGDEGDGLDGVMSTAAALSTKPVGMPKTTRIVLDESEKIPPTGLTVGLNGKAYLIRPGEEVDLPDSVLEVLDNAVETVPKVVDNLKRVKVWSNRPRFSYRVVRKVA